MKDLTKKIMILAMVGMVQIGFSAAVSEASSLQNFNQHKVIRFDDRHDGLQDPNDPQLKPQPQPRPEQPQLQPQPEQPQPQPE